MNSVKTLSAILVLVVIVLGAGIYYSMYGNPVSMQNGTTDTTMQPGVQNTTPGTTTGLDTSGQVTAIPGLTAEQKAILTPPQNGTPQEQQAYSDMVTAKAKAVSSVNVASNCLIDPMVVKATAGMTLTFKNTDSQPHTFSFDSTHSVTAPAGESKSIKLDFLKGGIYGFGCDAITGPVGMIVVAQ